MATPSCVMLEEYSEERITAEKPDLEAMIQ